MSRRICTWTTCCSPTARRPSRTQQSQARPQAAQETHLRRVESPPTSTAKSWPATTGTGGMRPTTCWTAPRRRVRLATTKNHGTTQHQREAARAPEPKFAETGQITKCTAIKSKEKNGQGCDCLASSATIPLQHPSLRHQQRPQKRPLMAPFCRPCWHHKEDHKKRT